MSFFILKIFFSGLIALVPSKDGKEVTLLLLETNHGHQAVASSGAIPEHLPLLLARAKHCDGTCPTRDAGIADFLFTGSREQRLDSLAKAVAGGAAWQLAGSDLSLGKTPSGGASLLRSPNGHLGAVPTTPDERQDLSWLADLNQIEPSAGGLNPAMLSPRPPRGVIVARFRLKSGRVFTRSVIQVDGKVEPIEFRPLAAGADATRYERAAANWLAAEIRLPGDSVEIVEDSFDGKRKRSMVLTARDGVVEMAVLNISSPVEARNQAAGGLPQPGRHFALYWDLAKHPPAPGNRPVPQVSARQTLASGVSSGVPWSSVHQERNRSSVLLDRIHLSDDRGPYDRILCPMVQFAVQ